MSSRIVPGSWLACSFFILSIGGPAVGQVPEVEREALIDLYVATDGDGWFDTEGWLGPVGTECDWFGVSCADGDPALVVELDLFGNGLLGALPHSIGDFQALELLDLGENTLFGEIPSSIGDLTELQELYLDSNLLDGELPDSLGQLEDLLVLVLFFNELEGEIPESLGDLSQLIELDLGENFLTGTIPSFARLQQLQALYLDFNDLSGGIPLELGALSSLQELSLAFNVLEGGIPLALGGATQLRTLDLAGNVLSGPVPTQLGNLDQLEALFVESNRLVGALPESLGDLDSLVEIQLDWNGLEASEGLADRLAQIEGGQYWQETQTLPPTGVMAESLDATSLLLTWSPMDYLSNDGGYVVLMAEGGGSFQQVAEIEGKTERSLEVGELKTGVQYWFRLQSYTEPHDANIALVVSSRSDAVVGTVASDSAGRFEISSQRLRGTEGETKRVRVRRVGGAAGAVTVDFAISPVTADEGVDFAPNFGTLQWADGDSESKTFEIELLADAQREQEEELLVVLGGPTGGATLGSPAEVSLTISDRDLVGGSLRQATSRGSQPAVSTAADGSRVLVWRERAADGGDEIWAQRYGTTGNAVGQRILVSANVQRLREDPDVALAADGSFFVVWAGAGQGVVGSSFGPDGSRTSAETIVGVGAEPAVDNRPGGGWFVAWSDAGTVDSAESGEGAARAVAAGPGEPIRAGSEVATMERAGTIFGRSFTSVGVASSPVVEVATVIGSEAVPDVAVDASDRAMVVWQDQQGGVDETDVFGTTVEVSSGTVSGPGRLNSVRNGNQSRPQVALTADGFVAVWQSDAPDPTERRRSAQDGDGARWGGRIRSGARAGSIQAGQGGSRILGRFFDASGQPGGEQETTIASSSEATQEAPAVASNGMGDCAVAWQEEGGSAGAMVKAAKFPGCDPSAVGASVAVASSSSGLNPHRPAVSLDDDAELTVAIEIDDPDESDGGVVVVAGRESVAESCETLDDVLCLTGSRFRVEIDWRSTSGSGPASGRGQAMPITNDTGYFWFFNEDNVEVVVKVLDACMLNDRFWVFAGGLTNVEVDLTITDTSTGTVVTYRNPDATDFQPIQDTDAFATCSSSVRWSGPGQRRSELVHRDVAGDALCVGGETVLCVNDGRFEVEIEFETPAGAGGPAHAIRLTEDTGYFWFFDEDNVEVVIKVLDACRLNDRFWVFAAGLTSVETTITVRDTVTGEELEYQNPQRTPFAPVLDTSAFATCAGAPGAI